MSEINVLKQSYRLNRRVRQNYLQTMMKLSTGELSKDRGASYPSFLDIFDHVLDAYDFWFVQFLGARLEGESHAVEDVRTMQLVTAHEKATGDAVMRYTEQLTETDLDREIIVSEEFPPRGWETYAGTWWRRNCSTGEN